MDKEINIEGKKIFYRIYGNGKPVVLIHGFGEAGEIWEKQVKFLIPDQSPTKPGVKLIVPDLPGSGQSDMIDDMSMEGMAEVIKTILDTEAAKIDSQATLIGHSMGGYITLAFAEKYQEDLRSFGLFHSSAFADSEEKIATRRKGIEFIKERGAFEFLKTAIPNLFGPDSKQKIPDTIDELISKGHNFTPQALVSYYESMIKRPDRTAILKKTKMPVLLVLGKHDVAVPLEDGLKQCHMPERSYITILNQSGHMGMLEETEKANQSLAEFLSES